ncbi:hypothetical protein B0H11DRAFT_1754854 [Mycena galericulata]|nr:hypothetical protein B0H11DRAFT_1754854 [Mycena galericulata]
MMLSTHLLALERLRHVDHEHQSVPRDERLCRLCLGAVESLEHALVECQALRAILDMRNVFLDNSFRAVPKMQTKMAEILAEISSVEFLKAIIYERSTIVLVDKFVHDVLEEFYAVPVYHPGGRNV